MDPSGTSNEHRRDRLLSSVDGFSVVVVVIGRVRRGEQADVPPAARTPMVAELPDRDLGGDGKVRSLGDVWRLTVDGIDDRCARRAGGFQGEAGLARDEHEAIQQQGVLPLLEQLGKADRLRGARVAAGFLEGVVGRHLAAKRQGAPLGRDGFDLRA